MEGELEKKIQCQFILMNIVSLQAGKLMHSSCRSASPPDPILISPSIIYQVAFPPEHLYLHCKELPNTDCAQIYADTFKCCVKCPWIMNLIGWYMHYDFTIVLVFTIAKKKNGCK